MYVFMYLCIHVCTYPCMHVQITNPNIVSSANQLSHQHPAAGPEVKVPISCLLVSQSVSIDKSFQRYQKFLLHKTPKKLRKIKKKSIVYVTIFAKQQLGDESKLCRMTFYQKQPMKSKHFAVICSAYNSVHHQKYKSSSPCR